MIAPRWLARVLILTYLTVISGGCVLFFEEDGDEEDKIITYKIKFEFLVASRAFGPGEEHSIKLGGVCTAKGDGVCSFEDALPFTLQVPPGASQKLTATLKNANSRFASLLLENVVTDPLKCGADKTDFLTHSGVPDLSTSVVLLRLGLARAKPKSIVKNRVIIARVRCR